MVRQVSWVAGPMSRSIITVLLALGLTMSAFAELGANVNVVVSRDTAPPHIIDTLPEDGSFISSVAPQIQFVFNMDMDTSRTDVRKVLLPAGLAITGLVWSDPRTLSIQYTGSLDGYGAKRVDLADNYFCNRDGVSIPIGGGLAFAYVNPNSPPYTVGEITLTPAAPVPNQPAAFSITAVDPNGDPLAITWNFGDGGSAQGAAVTHTYTSEGPFLVTVAVDDGRGGVVTKSLYLAGGATPPGENSWVVAKAQVGLGFKKAGKDKIAVTGVVELPADFSPAGKTASVDFGGAAQTFKLNAKGMAKTGKDQFKLTRKLVKKVFRGGAVKIQFKLGGAFVSLLADEGLANATIPKTGTTVTVRALLQLDGRIYEAQVPLLWKAKAGKSGKGTWQTAVR